jgi:hypothetical protein
VSRPRMPGAFADDLQPASVGQASNTSDI